MTFDDDEFNVILDKGTLDALFTSNEKSVVTDVRKYLSQCARVLSPLGRFICVSLAQNHIIDELLDFFCGQFSIRIHSIEQEHPAQGSIGSKLPIFVFVMTKLKCSCKFHKKLFFIGGLINDINHHQIDEIL